MKLQHLKQQAGENQYKRAPDAGRDLREGHQLHPACGGQNGHVAGTAHIGHAEPRRDRRLDGVEPHEPAQ